MGAFFTNVQVRSDDVDAIVDAIRSDAGRRGMDEIGAGGASADRAVVVLPPLRGWITIYDEATESQDPRTLDALARLATKATDAHGFSVLVHDSDVLDLRLYRAGTPLDHVDTYPGYFGGRPPSRKKRAAVAGDPDAWAALGADREELAQIFRAEELFAERTLAKLVALLGIDPARARRGYRYFDAEAEGASSVIVLRFRSRVRPSWERDGSGPPGLEVHGTMGDHTLTLAVPDELRVGLTARSTGAASAGLEVRAWGSALERGIVAVERFEIVLGDVLKQRRVVQLEARSAASSDGAPMRIATSEDLALPSGTADPFGGARLGPDVTKMMEAVRRSTVHVNVVGRCLAPGTGEIGVALVPLARPNAAAATLAKVEISSPIARPLRFDPRHESMPGGSSHLLAPLVGDRWHVALLVSDRSRRELTDVARQMIQDARFVIGSGEVRMTIYRASPGARPTSESGKTSAMLAGKRFASFLEAMRTEQLVGLIVTAGGAIDPHAARREGGHGRFGLSLGTSVIPHHEEDRVPAITAWLDGAHPGAAGVIDRWAEHFDAEVRSGQGIQATLTRGAWQPATVDNTAYESACGIANSVTTLREWVTRWLRVPGNDRTWLSAELAAHVGDRAALAAIAEVEPVGRALRITLRDRARYGDLELALSPLLPTGTESHAVSRAFFARAERS